LTTVGPRLVALGPRLVTIIFLVKLVIILFAEKCLGFQESLCFSSMDLLESRDKKSIERERLIQKQTSIKNKIQLLERDNTEVEKTI
jgi:predicted Holliday junction resolvase-like endonuclease